MTSKKFIKQNLIAVGVLAVLTIAILVLSRFENIAEFLTQHIYFEWAEAANYLISWIPFNLFEVEAFIVVAIVLAMFIYAIYQFVHKQKDQGWMIITSIILIIFIIAFAYSLIVGPIYNRAELDIEEEQTLLEKDEAISRVDRYFEDFATVALTIQVNEDGTSICPYSDQELEGLIVNEFSRLKSNYFCDVEPNPKRVVSSYLMSAFSISGITYLPNVEPGYNTQTLSIDKTLTIAHEIAHTKGIMREADANEVAFYILLTSDNNYLKYVGYLKTMAYMNRVYKLNGIDVGTTKIPSVALADYKASRAFWDEKAVMEKVGDFFNDIYLKLNSQDGTASYSSYDDYTQETTIDEEGNEHTIYTIKSYSQFQNMVFALYK